MPIHKLYSYLIIFICLTVGDCNQNKQQIDIVGKWYSVTKENGYEELWIDSAVIHAFSHWLLNQGGHGYKIIGDSLHYINSDLAVKINKLDDSTLYLVSKNFKDTLYRLNDTIQAFHEINYRNDSVFDTFYKQFNERAMNSYINHGIYSIKELEESIIDTVEIEEEIIEINQK